MQKKIKKPENPLEPDEEELEEEKPEVSQIIIADISVTSKNGLKSCRREIKQLLKDKSVRSYLGYYDKKRLMGFPPPDYIG